MKPNISQPVSLLSGLFQFLELVRLPIPNRADSKLDAFHGNCGRRFWLTQWTQQYVNIPEEISRRSFQINAGEGGRLGWHAGNIEDAGSPHKVQQQSLYEVSLSDFRDGLAVEGGCSVLASPIIIR